MAGIPVAQNLFIGPPEAPRLIGGRHIKTGKIVFPMPPAAGESLYEPVELNTRGTLWSWTVQRFRPKTPPYAGTEDDRDFKAFALGYVELEGEVIVESRIVTDDFDALKIGMTMELTLVPLRSDEDGNEILTYAFRPAG